MRHREESEEGHVHEQAGLQIVIELGVVVDGVREVRLQGLRQLPPRSPQVRARPFCNIRPYIRLVCRSLALAKLWDNIKQDSNNTATIVRGQIMILK